MHTSPGSRVHELSLCRRNPIQGVIKNDAARLPSPQFHANGWRASIAGKGRARRDPDPPVDPRAIHGSRWDDTVGSDWGVNCHWTDCPGATPRSPPLDRRVGPLPGGCGSVRGSVYAHGTQRIGSAVCSHFPSRSAGEPLHANPPVLPNTWSWFRHARDLPHVAILWRLRCSPHPRRRQGTCLATRLPRTFPGQHG